MTALRVISTILWYSFVIVGLVCLTGMMYYCLKAMWVDLKAVLDKRSASRDPYAFCAGCNPDDGTLCDDCVMLWFDCDACGFTFPQESANVLPHDNPHALPWLLCSSCYRDARVHETRDASCNTCGGSGVWQTTLEDSPVTLVSLGGCPDCRDATFNCDSCNNPTSVKQECGYRAYDEDGEYQNYSLCRTCLNGIYDSWGQ